MFSIQLKSNDSLKNVGLQHDMEGYNVLIEGVLGKLVQLSIAEGVMLEVVGAKGSLRMDFSEKELKGLFQKGTEIHGGTSEAPFF